MLTLLLEVKNSNSINTDYYNPAISESKAYPRTQEGIIKAIKKLIKTAKYYGFSEYRIAIYEGKKNYWNNKPFIGYVNIDKLKQEKILK